ncbi:MAG: ABC transporter ATP-binding protein [Actinomycetaceae bacterium]|nr:ABC transporter ATP-binding protein [Actinomycetaceae bacterium]
MIRVESLTKKYGGFVAVDNLTFDVPSGKVTGFLGPNGSGKSTTMRCILGLDTPSSGSATLNGVHYSQLPSPMTQVGALLDGKAFHKGRSAYQHLRTVALTHGLPERRIWEVLELTGLTSVARKKTKKFSLGMSQRLGIATALLGDPEILLFDEPVNGLDPEGVLWVRSLMRSLAAEGRTVLVSSHLMSEMENTADNVVIIGRGKLIDQGPMEKFTHDSRNTAVVVAGPQVNDIENVLKGAGKQYHLLPADELHPFGSVKIIGTTCAEIGALLHKNNVEIHELISQNKSLEEIFMELTASSVQYVSGAQMYPPASFHAGQPVAVPQSPVLAPTVPAQEVTSHSAGAAVNGHMSSAATEENFISDVHNAGEEGK